MTCLCSEKFKQCLTVVHSQPITSPLHVVRGYKGQTVTITLPAAETVETFCFLVGSAARSDKFMNDLTGLQLSVVSVSACHSSSKACIQ